MKKFLLLSISFLALGFLMPKAEVQLMGCAYGSKIQGRKSGIYKISTTEPEMTLINEKPQATGGGTYGKGHYYCQWYMSMFGTEVWTNMDFNTDTWEMKGGIGGRDTWAYDLAYDDTTDRIYGCFHDPDENYEGKRLVFGWITPENYIKDYSFINNICDVFVNMAGMDFDSKGQLWAISREGVLMTINKETGELTEVALTGLEGFYNTSAAIDKATDTMYYFLQLKGGTSEGVTEDTTTLYKIDLATSAVTKVYDLPGAEAIQGLAIFVPEAADNAPAAATDVKHSFTEGNLNGTISFTIPEVTYSGGAMSGTVSYKVLCRPYEQSEAEYALLTTGIGTCGQIVDAQVTAPGNGRYTFAVVLSNAEGEESPKALTDTYVGFDKAISPGEVKAEIDEENIHVSWTAPTSSVNNGYVDYDNLKYNVVRFPDEVTVVSGIAALEITDPMPAVESRTRYTYKVYADNHGMLSAPRESNIITLGSYTAPYTCDFNEREEFDEFTILTKVANPTHFYHWDFYPSYNAAKLSNSTADNDDWLITPAINLKGGETYKVTVVIGNDDAKNPALYSVCAGTAPTREGMEQHKLLTDASVIAKYPNNETVTATFTAAADGEHYIGVHGSTAAREWITTYVYSISVANESLSGIGQVADGIEEAAAEYFTIDGRRIIPQEAHGLVIVRRGNKVTKEIIR